MPKKKSVRRKDTKKKRKLARLKTSMRARKPAHTKRRELRGESGDTRPAPRVALEEDGIGLEVGPSENVERMASMARANLESVEELAEEGQPFEAEVLAGVEQADDSDESEVITHEVLEDDVPSEYERER
jgi:hypothetical protein